MDVGRAVGFAALEKVVFATAGGGHAAWMYWVVFKASSKVGAVWYPMDGGIWKF